MHENELGFTLQRHTTSCGTATILYIFRSDAVDPASPITAMQTHSSIVSEENRKLRN